MSMESRSFDEEFLQRPEDSSISPLRQGMINAMNLAGLAMGTQQSYIGAVSRLQKISGIRPDRMTEQQVHRYLIDMRDAEGVAKGTFQTNYFGLRFFYYQFLDRDWSLFTKKKYDNLARNVFRNSYLVEIVAA